MTKKLMYGLIVAIPVIICIIAVSIRVAVPKTELVTIEGDIEVNVRPYYVQTTGQVTSLPVNIGQTVKMGDVLALLDDSQARFELEQLNYKLIKAEAGLRDLDETGNERLKQAQVDIAQNNVTIAQQSLSAAQEALQQLRDEYVQLQILFDAEVLAQSELDLLAHSIAAQEKTVAISAAQLANAKEQLIIADVDTQTDMTEKIAMAQSDVDSIKAQITFAQSQLEHYTVRALNDGVVISIGYDEGGLAISGTQICELSKEDYKEFVFYLPEEYIDYVDYGTVIRVTGKSTDKDQREYKATVQYIDLKAQYTPKEVESSVNKNRLSFKVKALLEPGCELRVAQKASVTLGK